MAARKTLVRNHRLGAAVGILAALAAICLLLPASRAAAAKIDITPSISLDQMYDSNVFNTNGNEKEDFILRATPAVTFSLKMPETTLNLRTSLTSDTYYKYTELNSTNSAITLALDSTPPLALSPRLSIAPSGHFVQARNSYLRTQLVPTADPLVPPSIASESATQKSRDYGAALRVTYLLTEKTDFSLGGGFSKLQFLDNTAGNVGSRVISGDTSLSYKFTPLFSSGIFFNTSYNTFENGTDSRVFAGGLTGTYRFSPAFTVDARAGASHMKETSGSTSGVPENTKTSPYGALSLVYSGREYPCIPLRDDRAGRRGKPRGDHPEGIRIPFRKRSVCDAVVGRPHRDLSGQPLPGAQRVRGPYLRDRVPQGSATRRWNGWTFTCPGRDSASRGTGRWGRISRGTPPSSV